jgi:hypothetical protein
LLSEHDAKNLKDKLNDEGFTALFEGEKAIFDEPKIVFNNNIGKVTVDKQERSFKVVWDLNPKHAPFLQLHQNRTGVFSLSCQEERITSWFSASCLHSNSKLLWRMRQYPFDFYECCIDLNASRHTRPKDAKRKVAEQNATDDKTKLCFKQLDLEWVRNFSSDIELVANEWSVWKTETIKQDERQGNGILESLYLDHADNNNQHYQISFGAVVAVTVTFSRPYHLTPLHPRHISQKQISRV